jgi:hypothetical protein
MEHGDGIILTTLPKSAALRRTNGDQTEEIIAVCDRYGQLYSFQQLRVKPFFVRGCASGTWRALSERSVPNIIVMGVVAGRADARREGPAVVMAATGGD